MSDDTPTGTFPTEAELVTEFTGPGAPAAMAKRVTQLHAFLQSSAALIELHRGQAQTEREVITQHVDANTVNIEAQRVRIDTIDDKHTVRLEALEAGGVLFKEAIAQLQAGVGETIALDFDKLRALVAAAAGTDPFPVSSGGA